MLVLGTLGSLSKRGRGRQHCEAIKIFLHNPCVFLGIYLLWLPCLFLFSLNFSCFQRLFLNEKIDVNSWNIDLVLQTTWKWSNWRLTRAGGTNVSLISHIYVRFLSCVISLIVLPTLPSPSSAVLPELPITWLNKNLGFFSYDQLSQCMCSSYSQWVLEEWAAFYHLCRGLPWWIEFKVLTSTWYVLVSGQLGELTHLHWLAPVFSLQPKLKH